MTRATAVFLGVCLLAAGLLAAAIWGARRTHTANDYLIANRRLDVWLTAFSYTANALPAWLLFALLGAAFLWGLSAVWMALALLAGSAVNWFYIAPRLRRLALGYQSVSIVQVIGTDAGERLHGIFVRSSALILSVAFVLLIASQLNLLAQVAAEDLGVGATATIIVCASAYSLFIAVGGYWAASAADTAATIVLFLIALLLIVPATIAAGGFEQMRLGFETLGPSGSDWFGARTSVVAIAFTIGTLGLGSSLIGQPHVLSRLMAVRDERTLQAARWWSLGFSAALLGAFVVAGWCAQVMYGGLSSPDLALFALATRLLPPGIGALFVVALLGAVVASIGGQLLALSAFIAADVKRTANASLPLAKVATVGIALIAACVALYAPDLLLSQSVLAFSMLGAAFGPLLLVRMSGKRVRPNAVLGAMWAGAVLTWLFHVLPDSPGDFLERVLPFVAALGIALSGGERRNNPDRADRKDETVHDRVPI